MDVDKPSEYATPSKVAAEPLASPGNAPATPPKQPSSQAAPQASPDPSPVWPETKLKPLVVPADISSVLYVPNTNPTYLYLFRTKLDGAKGVWPFTCAEDFLTYITGGKGANAAPPKVVFVGVITSPKTQLPGDIPSDDPVPEPDQSVEWDTVAVLEFPPSSGDPLALGAGVAHAVWSAELEPKQYPRKPEDVADAPVDGNPALQKAMDAAGPAWITTASGMETLKKMIAEHSPYLPPEGPANGINLLRFRPELAQYYERYLYEAYNMISNIGGHLHFYGTVKPKPGSTAPYYSELLIPYYPSSQSFITVAEDPAYHTYWLHRAAATKEAFLPGTMPLEGSLFMTDANGQAL